MKPNITKKLFIVSLLILSLLVGPTAFAREASEGPRGFDSPSDFLPDDSRNRNSSSNSSHRSNDDFPQWFNSHKNSFPDNWRVRWHQTGNRFFFRAKSVEKFDDDQGKGKQKHLIFFKQGPRKTVFKEKLTTIFRDPDTNRRHVERSFWKFIWR